VKWLGLNSLLESPLVVRKSNYTSTCKFHTSFPGKAPRKKIPFEQWGTKTTQTGEKIPRLAHKTAARILFSQPSLQAGFLDTFVSHF